MDITRRTDYAIRIVMELARLPQGELSSARRLSELQGVPLAFARSIVQELAAAGLLETRRGGAGGVTLSRPARSISLLEAIEAVEGPVSLNLCTTDPDYCSRPGACAVHEVWREAEDLLTDYLGSVDFENLAARSRHVTAVRAGDASPRADGRR